MNKEDRLKEQYAKMHDWEKIKGIKFDMDGIEDDLDYIYFDKEQFKERAKDCVFWQYAVAEENVYEDIDDVIGYIEDHCEVPDFSAFKKAKVSPSHKTGVKK